MKTKHLRFNLFSLIVLIVLSLALLLISCGGGGGGSGGGDIGDSTLQAEPATLEVGGIQKISVGLSDVTENLAIKVRYPAAMEYVSGSAVFINGEDRIGTNPAYDLSETPASDSPSSSSSSSSSSIAATPTPTPTPTPTAKASGSTSSKTTASYEKRYLVFFITKDAFGKDPSGSLRLNLRAKNVLESGRIELDVDLDDPSIANNREFSVANPLFEAEQAADVRIRN